MQTGRLPAAAVGAGLEALRAGDADPTRGKAHLVAHHAALQQRSYLSALRSLHRFFDYNAGGSRAVHSVRHHRWGFATLASALALPVGYLRCPVTVRASFAVLALEPWPADCEDV